MKLSGHKSVSSLNYYKKPSLDQQRSMSTLLSHCQPSCSGVTISATNQEVHDKNQLSTTQGLLTNATFNNCSLDIIINTPGPTSQQVITPRTSHPAPKRPRVMYDWLNVAVFNMRQLHSTSISAIVATFYNILSLFMVLFMSYLLFAVRLSSFQLLCGTHWALWAQQYISCDQLAR